ncbi:hypothetical protein [Ralstonia solanacearum]|nr:hypothetical protein [Ralstonia solanacearum]ATJ84839.1 hypothetical protein CDC59_00275 [Ralstonia solanacearum]KEI30859.1 hypothetical protein CQ06_03340 [Ralstonia solanacearum]KFX81600.1 hypothetical protein KR99_22115 [Ralstonia solanacearum]KFZ92643.1 hypothetical protein CR47_0219300 [Ralstonia solanacearum]MDN4066115.1 hypothetical protein [Ralstonia solanacearum]
MRILALLAAVFASIGFAAHAVADEMSTQRVDGVSLSVPTAWRVDTAEFEKDRAQADAAHTRRSRTLLAVSGPGDDTAVASLSFVVQEGFKPDTFSAMPDQTKNRLARQLQEFVERSTGLPAKRSVIIEWTPYETVDISGRQTLHNLATVHLRNQPGAQDLFYIPTMGGMYLLSVSVFDRPVEAGHQLAKEIASSIRVDGKF